MHFPLLSPMGKKIKAHWKEHRPKMYAALEKEGKLELSVYAAQELTKDALYEFEVTRRLRHELAWGIVRGMWAFLPSEEDQPHLSFDPAELPDQLRPVSTTGSTTTQTV